MNAKYSRRLVSIAASVVAAVALCFPLLTSAAPVSGASGGCDLTQTFEAGIDGWATHYAGAAARSTSSPYEGIASLELAGTKGTARRTIAAPCATSALTTLTLFARSTGAARLIVSGVANTPNPPFLDPPKPYVGPFLLASSWTPITITLNVPGTADIHIEVDQPAGVTTYIDNVEFTAATTTPTTAPATTTPNSTTPPTTTPLGACRTDTFEADADGWTSWWSGTAARTSFAGRNALRLAGSPGTARRTILPADCPGLQFVTFEVGIPAGQSSINAFVKTIDIATGAQRLVGPTRITGGEDNNQDRFAAFAAPVPVTVGTSGVTIAIEAYSSTGSLVIDNVAAVAAAPATCPTDTFSAGFDGWTSWWAGSLDRVDLNGSTALALGAGNGGVLTAQRTIATGDCRDLTNITFDVGAAGITAPTQFRFYVKTIDLATGATNLTGPVIVNSGQPSPTNTFRVPFPVAVPAATGAGGVAIAIEAYFTALGYVYIDDVRYNTGTVAPTTTTTSTTTTSTTTTSSTTTTTLPTTTGYDCFTDDFSSGDGGGFTQWWSGDINIAGQSFQTARRIVTSEHCSAPITSTRLALRAFPGDNLVVRRFDLATGVELPRRTVTGTAPYGEVQVIDVPLSVGSAGMLLGLEMWRPTSPTTSDPSSGYIVNFALRSATPPPAGQVPTAPTVRVSALAATSATLNFTSNSATPIEYRTTLSGVDFPNILIRADSQSSPTFTGLPTDGSGGFGRGLVRACNRFGCSAPTTFSVSDLRPVPAGACHVEEYEPGETNSQSWAAWTTGTPIVTDVRGFFGATGNFRVQLAETPKTPPQFPTWPLTANAYVADAQRLIMASECPGMTITSLQVDTGFSWPWGASIAGSETIELTNPATGQTRSYRNGDPIGPIPSAGLVVRVRWDGVVINNYKAPVAQYEIKHLVLIGS